MKLAILCEGLMRDNLGDIIQTIAAERLVGKPDYILDRENLSTAKGRGEVFLYCNGWFMHNPSCFPPPQNVRPFYISVHIANKKILENKKNIMHLRKNGPIGARDIGTLITLRSKRIPAYYSGCVTLTIKPTEKKKKTDKVYFVDGIPSGLNEAFLESLPADIKNKAVHLSHVPPTKKGNLRAYYRKNKAYAEKLLSLYQDARLVITDKLHCALPCIALETPIILVRQNPDRWRLETAGRYLPVYKVNAEIAKIDFAPDTKRIKKKTIKKVELIEKLSKDAILMKANPISNSKKLSYRLFFFRILIETYLTWISRWFICKIGLESFFRKNLFKQVSI